MKLLRERFGVSERRACRVVGQHRSTQRLDEPVPDESATWLTRGQRTWHTARTSRVMMHERRDKPSDDVQPSSQRHTPDNPNVVALAAHRIRSTARNIGMTPLGDNSIPITTTGELGYVFAAFVRGLRHLMEWMPV